MSSSKPSESFADALKQQDVVQQEIARMRPGLYRRLLGDIKMRRDSPLLAPPIDSEPAALLGKLDAEVSYNPLLPSIPAPTRR